MAKTTNEFGVVSEKVGNTFKNDYKNQTQAQSDAMWKSIDDSSKKNPGSMQQNQAAAATTQMASVVNAALGKATPKTWDEFSKGMGEGDDAWRKRHGEYLTHLKQDKFGLTEDVPQPYTADAWMGPTKKIGTLGTSFLPESTYSEFSQMYSPTQKSSEKYDQAKYDRVIESGGQSFEDYMASPEAANVKDADYVTQRDQYKKMQNRALTGEIVWGKGGTDNIPSHIKQKTFEDFDPGLFTAGDDYGQFSGAYRTQDEVDTKFQDYYSDEINKLGYGNLVTEGLDNAGYLAAFDQATNRKGLADQITGLGYGSMVNPNMTADQLNTAFGEAQERNKFKGLLDGMGTSYGDMDSSSSLGSLYDTVVKLDDADQKAAGLTTELGLLNTDFDALSTDYGALQGDNTALTTDLSALTTDYGAVQGASQQQQGMAAANAVAANKAQRQNVGIASIPGPSASPYTAAVAPTGATALQANPYQMAPIDFTGGLAGADSDGTVGQTNIFAPPQMSMTQNPFDLNQSFNPYFDALNTQYGIPPVGETT